MLYQPQGSRFWWMKFKLNGRVIRRSTETENKTKAREIEQNYKVDLRRSTPPPPVHPDPVLDAVLDEVVEERFRVPTLAEFIDERFMPFVRTNNAKKPNTVTSYRTQSEALKKGKLGAIPLDQIDQRHIQEHVTKRRAEPCEISTVNRDLATLRRALKLAEEWRVLKTNPVKVRLLRGENRRERVLTREEETKYLAAAPPLLKDVATLLFDLGLRPEECYRLTRDNFRDDSFVYIHEGKGSGSRRKIACSERAKAILERRLKKSRMVFPAPTKAGHINSSSLKKQHRRALKESGVDSFVLYDIRHTAITRWSKKTDPFTLRRVAGHTDLRTTERYVHVDDERLLALLDTPTPPKRGHRRGHS